MARNRIKRYYPFDREFTSDSDLLILIGLQEGNTYEGISYELGRQEEAVKDRITMLIESENLLKLHNALVKYNGLYTRQYRHGGKLFGHIN